MQIGDNVFFSQNRLLKGKKMAGYPVSGHTGYPAFRFAGYLAKS